MITLSGLGAFSVEAKDFFLFLYLSFHLDHTFILLLENYDYTKWFRDIFLLQTVNKNLPPKRLSKKRGRMFKNGKIVGLCINWE